MSNNIYLAFRVNAKNESGARRGETIATNKKEKHMVASALSSGSEIRSALKLSRRRKTDQKFILACTYRVRVDFKFATLPKSRRSWHMVIT